MSSSAVGTARSVALLRLLRPSLIGLAVGVLGFAALFHTELQAGIAVWIASTAFGHCFLVLPIALYLAWERRGALAALLIAGERPRPQLLPLLANAVLAVAWLVAERIGIMEGRQLTALAMLEVLAYAVLGPVLWRCMAAPLLYLVFLVPFGGFLTPALQSFTVRFIDVGLGVLGIPHVVSNTIIEIPAGTFLVAEACAGLRFLIASIAFGVLYACTIYRSPVRRIVFIAASIVVPIIANGLRALGIVVLGDVLGSAQAASVDHIVYGWVFFTVVTVALILAGLPFREDRLPIAPPRSRDRSRHGRASTAGLVVAVGILLAAIGPATAAWLGNTGSSGTPIRLTLVLPTDCRLAGTDAAEQTVTCGDTHIAVRALLFSPRTSPQALLAAARTAAGMGEVVTSVQVAAGRNRVWQLAQTTEPSRIYAIGFWATADGSAAAGLAWRARQAIASVVGPTSAPWRPVLVAAVVEDAVPSARAADTLRRFTVAQSDLALAAQHGGS